MKSTGVVRRIDDSGRVIIPKEFRKRMKVKEGDPLELYITEDEAFCFKPYQEQPLTNDEILNHFDEMSREKKLELIKDLIENL